MWFIHVVLEGLALRYDLTLPLSSFASNWKLLSVKYEATYPSLELSIVTQLTHLDGVSYSLVFCRSTYPKMCLIMSF
jgi:hypothetical protein